MLNQCSHEAHADLLQSSAVESCVVDLLVPPSRFILSMDTGTAQYSTGYWITCCLTSCSDRWTTFTREGSLTW